MASSKYTPDYIPYIPPTFWQEKGLSSESVEDLITDAVYNLHDNIDLTDWLQTYGALTGGVIRSREHPERIIVSKKSFLKPYPTRSRPVLTNVAFEESRSTIGRLYSVLTLRTMILPVDYIMNRIKYAYFRGDWNIMARKFNEEKLIFNGQAIKDWLSHRSGAEKISMEVLEALAGELMIKPISDINVHLKLESLLKDNPIMYY
jgi:hypothetical protein